MKLQSLVVIFTIIIIPVTLILSAYIQTQIDTESVQQLYDTKLLDATHDAVTAFQLNTFNNEYSTNSDSIRRDILASINTFTNSLSNSLGYGTSVKNTVLTYVPAIVVTLYDGYYIYSPYNNSGTYEHVLKPYIYYSAKYVQGNDYIVVNYSLDNFITVYGWINNKYVYNSGYIIDLNRVETKENQIIAYEVVPGRNYEMSTLDAEELYEITEGDINEDSGYVSLNEETTTDYSAKEYYQKAYEFSKWLEDNGIYEIVIPNNAIRNDGTKFNEIEIDGVSYASLYGSTEQVLRFSATNNEELGTSAFNQHKRDIMRISIQDNLNSAIANYNEHSGSMGITAGFSMPKLTEQDWEKILTNVNIISFMQGLQAGTKVYNNYAIVTNTNNKQYVSPDSLYFINYDEDVITRSYHTINCEDLDGASKIVGYKSVDFQKRKTSQNELQYYYLHNEMSCYKSVVTSLDSISHINGFKVTSQSEVQPYQWFKEKASDVQIKAYYYALAREKNNLNKTTEKNTAKSKVLVMTENANAVSADLASALNSWFESVTYTYADNETYTNEKIKEDGYKIVIYNQSAWSASTDRANRLNELYASGINLITIGNDSQANLDIIESVTHYTDGSVTNINKVSTNGWFTNMPSNISTQSDSGGYVVNKFREGTEIIYTSTFNGTTYPTVGLYTNSNRTRWLHIQLKNDSNLYKALPEVVEYMLSNTGAISLPTDLNYSNSGITYRNLGNNNSSDLGSNINLNGNDTMTMSVVFKPSELEDGEHAILSSGKEQGWKITVNENGNICAQIYVKSGEVEGYQTLDSSVAIETNKSYHVVCSYTGSIMKLYVNGNLMKQKNVQGDMIQSSGKVVVGANPGERTGRNTDFFKGSVYSVKIYNEGLTSSQVQELWNRAQSEGTADMLNWADI